MPRIFISYRRADSKAISGRIHDRLIGAFGRENVFMDVDDIPPGVDFRAYLQNAIDNADIVLIVIGSRWASILRKRRNNPNDFVRIELETALEKRKFTIPVLVESSTMPVEGDVPERVRTIFPYLNAVKVGDNPDFHHDMDRLIGKLQRPDLLQPPSPLPSFAIAPNPTKTRILPATIVVLGIIGVIAAILLSNLENKNFPSLLGISFAQIATETPIPTQEQISSLTSTPSLTITPTRSATPTATNTPSTQPTAAPTDKLENVPVPEPTNAITSTLEANQSSIATLEITLPSTSSVSAQVLNIATATSIFLPPVAFISASQNVNLRSGPSTENGIVAVLVPGQNVIVLSEGATDDWVKIRLTNGVEGWIFHELITITGTETPVPTNTPSPTIDPTIVSVINLDISANDQWTPLIRNVNGVEMALVPSGCFMMGGQTANSESEPIVSQCLNQPFWIDRTEVTNKQFIEFGGFASSSGYYQGDNRPRENITWFEARNFCIQRGARLPNEIEWEYAARGPDNLIYPWGNYVAPVPANHNSELAETIEVGSYPEGASWVGAVDMAGNVEEWVSSLFLPYPYILEDQRESVDTNFPRVLRGGSWSIYDFSADNNQLKTFFRLSSPPDGYSVGTGFRCVANFVG